MKFQIDRTKYIDSGLISERFHPSFPLAIYNYTSLTQYSQAWDEVTMVCRGLIVHTETQEIIARPFPKFFNYEEHVGAGREIPNERPRVFAKLDGSLGILYWWGQKPYIATRGSFDSPQAVWATEYLQKTIGSGLEETEATHLFEIIGPQNRIVVQYKEAGLIYLGSTLPWGGSGILFPCYQDFPIAEEYPFTSAEELSRLNTKNEEGFVLWYPKSDLRLKIKFEDYKRLHKLYTGLNSIAVWEWLRDGVDPFAQDVPDEMNPWLESVVDRLRLSFNKIEYESEKNLEGAHGLPTRKEQAIHIKGGTHPSVAFAMLDGKDYSKAIWRMLRPKGVEVFRTDIDQ